MPISVVMPALEMAQETGKLVAWLKKEGDSIAKGEPLIEIETDKAVMEIESPADGILAGIKVQAGETVAVQTVVAVIDAPGSAAATAATPAAPAPAADAAGDEEPAALPGGKGKAAAPSAAAKTPAKVESKPAAAAAPAVSAPAPSAVSSARPAART